MDLGAFVGHRDHAHGDDNAETSIAWASLIAVLFAVVAALSFAVDQSVTLSWNPPPHTTSR